ncbi:MAG: LysM peptidoglycan-binding domain-containing protein [Akkermansiaceae bacterium]
MKKYILIKITSCALVAAAISSCALDPDYRQYKQQQAAGSLTPSTDTLSNPYGVPQSPTEIGAYTPAPDSAPYQAIPNVAQPSAPSYLPSPPAYSETPSSPASSVSYVVLPGDSLWALSRKFGTTVEAIQTTNNLTSTTIITGQTLLIPN